MLTDDAHGDVIPAAADQTTILWSLGKKLGDELIFLDERGMEFRILLVAALKDSILQGSLLISEENFRRRFPSASGRQVFLVDAPAGRDAIVAEALTFALRDVGLDVTRSSSRLAGFYAVQGTYLSMFQALGGLGLLLGGAAVAVLVLRNVLERRRELAMMRAVGFSRSALRRLIFLEHWWLLAWGVCCGAGAGIVAVGPSLRSAGSSVPLLSLGVTLIVVAVGGALWTWMAARLALCGKLLNALMNE
jgi:ABC-type antimicrobial peptide transport system permease subunit